MTEASRAPLPATPFLHLDEQRKPSLIGSRCMTCGAVVPGECGICPCCATRNQMEPIRLSGRGRLYTYTIVQRSFPGIETPFVAAVVDLDGGGTVNGTLLNVEPAPGAIPFDMPVEVVFRDSGQKSADGRPFISYCFVPGAAR